MAPIWGGLPHDRLEFKVQDVSKTARRKIGQSFVLQQYHLSTVGAQARDYGQRAARTGPMHSVDEINAS